MTWESSIRKWWEGSTEAEGPKNPKGEGAVILRHRGLKRHEIEEILEAADWLRCKIFGDLEIEVEKMFALETLHKYGFTGLEQLEMEFGRFGKKL